MISAGFITFMGVILLMAKLPYKWSLWLLGKPFLLDLFITGLTAIMLWGTFSGMMAAGVAGLMASIFTAVARYVVGYIDKGRYHPGRIFDLTRKLYVIQ